MKKRLCWLVLYLLIVLAGSPAIAQLSITFLSNPLIAINSASAYQNGVTISNGTVRVSSPRKQTWQLSMRAAGDPAFNGQSIALNQVSVRVTNTTVTTQPEKPLSTALQLIASDRSGNGGEVNVININYRVNGGNHLLKPAGNYTTTLTFSLAAL